MFSKKAQDLEKLPRIPFRPEKNAQWQLGKFTYPRSREITKQGCSAGNNNGPELSCVTPYLWLGVHLPNERWLEKISAYAF